MLRAGFGLEPLAERGSTIAHGLITGSNRHSSRQSRGIKLRARKRLWPDAQSLDLRAPEALIAEERHDDRRQTGMERSRCGTRAAMRDHRRQMWK
jgi:hypothetical protein